MALQLPSSNFADTPRASCSDAENLGVVSVWFGGLVDNSLVIQRKLTYMLLKYGGEIMAFAPSLRYRAERKAAVYSDPASDQLCDAGWNSWSQKA